MSQDDQDTRGGLSDQAAPDEGSDQETSLESGRASDDERHVSHKTYRQTVAEAKAMRQRAKAAEERLKALEDERLEAAGQKDELIKSLRSKLDGETKRTKELYNSFARKSLNAQMKAAALEAGCIDPDAVMSLADLSSIEVSTETFQADDREVKDVITSLRKSKPYLFAKSGPGVNSRLPGGGRIDTGSVDPSKMSNEEIREWLLKNGGKG